MTFWSFSARSHILSVPTYSVLDHTSGPVSRYDVWGVMIMFCFEEKKWLFCVPVMKYQKKYKMQHVWDILYQFRDIILSVTWSEWARMREQRRPLEQYHWLRWIQMNTAFFTINLQFFFPNHFIQMLILKLLANLSALKWPAN